MVADGARAKLDAVADDVVLPCIDGEGILGLERLQPALRHRERVMAEVDLLGGLVVLAHREVDDPAGFESLLGDQPPLLAHLRPRLAPELPCNLCLVLYE